MKASEVKFFIIHCSAVRPEQQSHAIDIDGWHRARGYRCIGYHFVIWRDGTIEQGRKLSESGAHCRGYNSKSIGICYEGGLDADGKPSDTRTEAQKYAFYTLLLELHSRFPSAVVRGHNQFSKKACPCFDAQEAYDFL